MSGLLYCLVMALFLYIPMKESMHMLQQNRYQTKRYRIWLQERIRNKHRSFLYVLFLFLPIYALYMIVDTSTRWNMYILLIIIYAYVFWMWDQKHAYIIKIKFTHRIQRLYILFSIVYLGWNVFSYVYVNPSVLIFCTPLLFLSPWAVLFLIQQVAHPLEQAIRNSYAKEAKSILMEHKRLKKIGITGSYGKTSVKNILYTLLQEDYYTLMSPHSYNNQMGLTITIRSFLKSLHEVFIAEMGADHVGEIEDLMNFIEPTIGIVCAVGPQHLETFQTQERILHEKMKVVECLPKDGIAIINYDNIFIKKYTIQNTCKVITYGIHNQDVDCRAVGIHYSPKGTSFQYVSKEESFHLETCLLGEHNVLNIMAAICVAKVMGIEKESIQRALTRLRYVEHRLQVRSMAGYTILDDAYNSNPEGAKYALEVLAQMPGQHILITPGFLDLGDKTLDAHQEYAKQMAQCADQIILVGFSQTKDICNTLIRIGYPTEQMYIAKHTKEAFIILNKIKTQDATVLIENDLPDAFNH